MNKDKIYYFSNYDNQIHNINDTHFYNKNESLSILDVIIVDILDSNKNVIDTVRLYTINEIKARCKK